MNDSVGLDDNLSHFGLPKFRNHPDYMWVMLKDDNVGDDLVSKSPSQRRCLRSI